MFLDKKKTYNINLEKKIDNLSSQINKNEIPRIFSKLGLNFEFQFFKEIKQRFYDDEHIRSESDLEKIMNTCLSECIKQFILVRNQNQFFRINQILIIDDCDEEDELNMIELKYNFKVNLLNVLYRFKESFDRITHCSGPADTKKINYYHYMSALVSIYLDINLDLNSNLSEYKIKEFTNESLKDSLCLNTYYLLDSCVYYVCNCILQLEVLSERNFDVIIPIINKIMAEQTSCAMSGSIRGKISRSLYLRILLIASRLNCFNKYKESEKLKNFKKYVINMVVPNKFINFANKILKNYCEKSRANYLIESISHLRSDKKLCKFITSKLTPKDIQVFIYALHNKTADLKVSKENHKYRNNQILNKLDEHIDVVDGRNFYKEDESNYNIPQLSHNVLNITSSSELTQYDIMSYEDFDFEEKDSVVSDIIKPIKFNQPNIEIKYQEKDNLIEKLLQYPGQQLNLEQFQKIDENFNLVNRETNLFHDEKDFYSSPFKRRDDYDITEISEERIFSSRKKYEAKQRSPSKETISKLNLFRNIYDSESERTEKYKNIIEKKSLNAPKFYKLNENVSVLLNIDDSPKKLELSISPTVYQNPKRKLGEEKSLATFVQTKLNFKIKKSVMNSNLSTILDDNTKQTNTNSITLSKKDFDIKKRSYKKFNYKSLPQKTYTLRKRNSNKNYMETP